MNIQITANEDENFKITVKPFGEAFIAYDGERVALGSTEQVAVSAVQEMQEVPVIHKGPKPAPLENPKKGHPFDFFAGTSWEGKRQW